MAGHRHREPVIPKGDDSPPHDVYRAFRRVMDSCPGERMAVVETGAPDDVVALFVRPDEMHLAFNLKFAKAAGDVDQRPVHRPCASIDST